MGDGNASVFVFLTAGFIIGALVQRLLHQPEEYVFQNLGISNLQRYTFAYIIHISIALIALFLIWIIKNHV
jgi:hypothetical protein